MKRQLLSYNLNFSRSREDQALQETILATTFSDFITVLLCFFLTMVSFGPLGKAQRNQELKPPPPPEAINELKGGTALALQGGGAKKRIFWLSQEQLSQLSQESVSPELDQAIKLAVSEGYQRRRVTITVTPQSESYETGPEWLSIIQRLTMLQRQLFDANRDVPVVLKIAELPRIKDGQGSPELERKSIVGLIEIEEES